MVPSKRKDAHGSNGKMEDRKKRAARTAVYIAKWDAQAEEFDAINSNDDKNRIFMEMVSKAINKMQAGKAAGPYGIVIEMIRAAEDAITSPIAALLNRVIHEGKLLQRKR